MSEEKEGLFKKRLWKLIQDATGDKPEDYEGNKYPNGYFLDDLKLSDALTILEEAKKELFASMPKQTEPNITEDLDQDDTPLIVKISLEDWNAICSHWQILKRWFGGSAEK